MPNEKTSTPPVAIDYRDSHVGKGLLYDSALAANPFDAYLAKWERFWLSQWMRELHPHGIARYLDFACGTGRVTEQIAPLARESVGIDVSATMLDVARGKCATTRFLCTDVTRDKPQIGAFDLITSFRFFGNAQSELRDGALSALAAMLAPGGHLVIDNHRNPWSLAAILHRATGGSRETDLGYFKLKRLLAMHGLAIVRARAIGFWMFRSRLIASSDIANAPAALEHLFASRMFAPFAPAAMLLARKVAS